MYQLIFAASAKKLNVEREEVLVGLKVLICGRGCVKGRGETPLYLLKLKPFLGTRSLIVIDPLMLFPSALGKTHLDCSLSFFLPAAQIRSSVHVSSRA